MSTIAYPWMNKIFWESKPTIKNSALNINPKTFFTINYYFKPRIKFCNAGYFHYCFRFNFVGEALSFIY